MSERIPELISRHASPAQHNNRSHRRWAGNTRTPPKQRIRFNTASCSLHPFFTVGFTSRRKYNYLAGVQRVDATPGVEAAPRLCLQHHTRLGVEALKLHVPTVLLVVARGRRVVEFLRKVFDDSKRATRSRQGRGGGGGQRQLVVRLWGEQIGTRRFRRRCIPHEDGGIWRLWHCTCKERVDGFQDNTPGYVARKPPGETASKFHTISASTGPDCQPCQKVSQAEKQASGLIRREVDRSDSERL